MKYIITVKQELKYMETIMGIFGDLIEAQQFIETVMRHFEKVSIHIEIVTDDAEVDE